MVKKRVGTAEKTGTTDSNVQPGKVVTSGEIKSPRLAGVWKKQRTPIVVAVVLIVVIVAGLWYHHYQANKIVFTHLPTTEQYASSQVAKLQQNKPAANAPLQTKLAYYDQLWKQQKLAGNNKAAIATFNTRAKLSEQGLDYSTYYQLARLYQQTGDTAGALAALDKAEATIPPDDPATGFLQSDAEQNIALFRQELQQ